MFAAAEKGLTESDAVADPGERVEAQVAVVVGDEGDRRNVATTVHHLLGRSAEDDIQPLPEPKAPYGSRERGHDRAPPERS